MKTAILPKLVLLFTLFVHYSLWGQLELIHTNGPEGAGIGYIESDGEYAFFADQFFLYRTQDGITWEKLPHAEIWPMAGSPGFIAAYQYMGWSNSKYPVRFVISKDHGLTWQERTLPPVSSVSPDRFVVCSHGIYLPQANDQLIFRSDDEGTTWHSITLPVGVGGWVVTVEDRLFVRSATQIFELDPITETWSEFTSTLPAGIITNGLIKRGTVWMAATTKSIFISEDDGVSWELVLTSSFDFMASLFHTEKWTCIFNKSGSIYCTEDGGETWVEFDLMDSAQPNFYSANALKGFVLIPTYDSGVLRFDPEQLVLDPANSGLQSGAIYDLERGAGEVWATTANGIYNYKTDNGLWTIKLPLQSTTPLVKVARDESGVIAAYAELGTFVLLSYDDGTTWDSIDVISEPWFFGFIVDMGWHEGILYVYFDFDKAIKLDPNTLESVEITTHRYPCLFQGVYYAVTYDQKLVTSSNLDGVWLEGGNYPSGLLRVYTAGDRLFGLVVNSDITSLYTSENGIDWFYANDGLPQIDISEIFDHVFRGDAWKIGDFYCFFYPGNGLYQSIDQCQTWQFLGADHSSDIIFLDTVFYLGEFGGGVFRSNTTLPYVGLASGTVYVDENFNGVFDSGEKQIQHARVDVYETNPQYPVRFASTKGDGGYSVSVSTNAENTLRVYDKWKYTQSIVPEEYVIHESSDTLDFGVQFIPDIIDVALYGAFVGPLRSGFHSTLALTYINEGTTVVSGEIGMKLDPFFEYVNAKPAPSKVIGLDSLVWEYKDLELFAKQYIKIEGYVPASALNGQLITVSGVIYPLQEDADISDNIVFLRQDVVGSYDPNDKSVLPVEGLTKEQIANGEELEYTIRFQNTGNYYAERVRITDQLDTALNIQSIRFIDASHDVTSFDLLPDRWLHIVFDQIILPDSNENELESHGFVRFAIQRNTPINPDDKIDNQALIYFDFNDPIVTNTVTTELYDPTVAIEFPEFSKHTGSLLIIYPNPTNTQCTVWTKGLMSGPGQLLVSGMDGALVSVANLMDCAEPNLLSTARFVPGQYIIELKNDSGKMWGKLVVE